jgi:hypothetical protein
MRECRKLVQYLGNPGHKGQFAERLSPQKQVWVSNQYALEQR